MSDEKWRGKGADRKGTKRDGLRFQWKWGRRSSWSRSIEAQRVAKKSWLNARAPRQICAAHTKRVKGLPGEGYFTLEAIQWAARERESGREYQAEVRWVGDHVVNKRGLETRLEAQLWAERLLKEFLLCSYEQLFVRPSQGL